MIHPRSNSVFRFHASTDGFVTGVRFYKGAGNGGTHVGSLWSTAGERLATATFTGESATGWQTVTFDQAVPVCIRRHLRRLLHRAAGSLRL